MSLFMNHLHLVNAVWDHFTSKKEGLSIMLLFFQLTLTGLLLLGNLTGRV